MNVRHKHAIKRLSAYIGCTERLAEDLYLLAGYNERLVQEAYDETTHLTACKIYICNERLAHLK